MKVIITIDRSWYSLAFFFFFFFLGGGGGGGGGGEGGGVGKRDPSHTICKDRFKKEGLGLRLDNHQFQVVKCEL